MLNASSSTTPETINEALELLTSGHARQAEASLSGYCRLNPDDPAGWYLLGAALHAQQKTAAALAHMDRSLRIAPDQPEVLKATAILLLELHRYHASLARGERACVLAPNDPHAWLITGSILEALGNGKGALGRYERALELQRDWQPALLNRGALLMGLGLHRKALGDYQQLATLFPQLADSHFNLAEAQLACGDYMDAALSCRRALELNPCHVGANIDLALALSMLGEFDAARREFAASMGYDRDAAEEHFLRVMSVAGSEPGTALHQHPEDLFLWQHGELQKTCDWRYRDQLIRGMAARATDLERGGCIAQPFPAVYFHSLSLPTTAYQQLSLARGVATGISQRIGDGHPVRSLTRYRRMRGPLRIGYISPDFRLHPVAYLHWRQLALHDRERFKVFAYSLHSDDGSEIRKRVKSSCDEWRPCENDTARLTAARIRYDGIQVLVDLSGYTRFTRPEILALRPAPIQTAYMGMPATSGASFIDYRITDGIATPRDHAAYWTERLVYLPDTLFMYNNAQEIAPPPKRFDVGLPEAAFVFCCFNNAFKIEPDVFGIWMRLLLRVPGSVLWLLSDDEAVRDNLRREAEARGVAAGRLVFAPFLPFAEHLARYALADLFLDTFYCGAHTTAADALWGGLPVLTCLGQTMAARQAGSIVCAAGLPEMAVASHEEYEALAHRLANHPEELARKKHCLLDNRRHAPLFDTAGRVRELERAYEMMWQRHESGLPPASFAVASGGGTPG